MDLQIHRYTTKTHVASHTVPKVFTQLISE